MSKAIAFDAIGATGNGGVFVTYRKGSSALTLDDQQNTMLLPSKAVARALIAELDATIDQLLILMAVGVYAQKTGDTTLSNIQTGLVGHTIAFDVSASGGTVSYT